MNDAPTYAMLADMRDRALFAERELSAMTEQRDNCQLELQIVVERLKGNRHPDDNGMRYEGEIDIKAITAQRDRLAEDIEANHSGTLMLEQMIYAAREQRDEMKIYADKLAEGLPDGMLPKDVEVLREANTGLAAELTTVTAQRDRLDEAATTLIAAKGRHHTMLAYQGLQNALKSLNHFPQTPAK